MWRVIAILNATNNTVAAGMIVRRNAFLAIARAGGFGVFYFHTTIEAAPGVCRQSL